MATATTLPITVYRGAPVPNRFIGRLELLLPRFGYLCDMPLFYLDRFLLGDDAPA